MAQYGAHGLLMSLAMHPKIPASAADVRVMPVLEIWRWEVMMYGIARMERRQRLDDHNARVHAAAVQRMNKRRRR